MKAAVSRLGGLSAAVAILVIALDQATKHWVLNVVGLQLGEHRPLLGPVALTGVYNPGVSFGLLQANPAVARVLLTIFSLGVAVVLANWARKADRWLSALGLGLIIGGAIGNAIDRMHGVGMVIDFIDVQALLPFFIWIFNVADSAITVGVIALLIDSLRRERAA